MPRKSLPEQNHLLRALSPEVRRRLYPHLELVSLSLGEVLYESNCAMRYVYFPTNAIISVQYVLKCGDSTAIMVIGNDGILGLNLCAAGARTTSRSLVQSAGYAYRLSGRLIKKEFDRHGELLKLMLCYTQVLITQATQIAVCNRHHTIDQQLCRWLLLSLDRLPDNRVTMTQEFISNMLGVRRESVTQSATSLRNLGVIAYARGLITVLDRPGLERLSCECFEVVRAEAERLLHYTSERQTSRRRALVPVWTVTALDQVVPH